MLKQGDSSSRQNKVWLLSSTNFRVKCEMVFVLTQENGFILKPIERSYVPLKNAIRDF